MVTPNLAKLKREFEAQWPKRGLYEPYIPAPWPCPHAVKCLTVQICGQTPWLCPHVPPCAHRTACAILRGLTR